MRAVAIFVAILVVLVASQQEEKYPIWCSCVARTLCNTVFLANREFSPERPYLQELADEPGNHVNIHVDHDQKSVKATAIRDENVFRIAKFVDLYRGCVIVNQPDTISFEPIELDQKHFAPSSDLPVSINHQVQQLVEKQFENTRLSTRSLIVWHNDKIIAEKHLAGFTQATPQHGWSLTKSLLNTMYGVLVRQNKVSIKTKIEAPEWESGDPRNALTVDDFMKMASGLKFNETYGYGNDPAKMFFNSSSVGKFAASKPQIHPPGTHWSYSSGDTNVLARKLRNLFSSDTEYWKFPRENLFSKLGMSPKALVNIDSVGDFVFGGMGFLSARDWLRLGILYLNDGMWGTERILDSEWIKYSSTPSEVSRGFYASQFWIPRLSGLQGSYQAVGWRVQRIFIFPAKKLVILRLGCTEGLPWNEGSFYREVISLLPTTDQPDQQ